MTVPTKPEAKSEPLFRDFHCEEVLFRIKITHDKFNYAEFVKDTKQNPGLGEWAEIVSRSRNADYHSHLAWTDEKSAIRLQVGFYTDPPEKSLIGEHEIFAEDCMAYVGKFFVNESAQSHIHADFDFKSGRKSRFPLPLKTSIGTCKAEVDSIGLRLNESPSGVSQLWLMQRKDGLNAQLYADKKIVFKDFSVTDELRELLSVLESLTEEKL
jgi:hypothetical protein